MSSITPPIDPRKIEAWIRDIGCVPMRAIDPTLAWRIEFEYPPSSGHKLQALVDRARPRALVIVSDITISPQHVDAHRQLDPDEKQSFFFALQDALTDNAVEYALVGVDSEFACPAKFQVSAFIYDDGLTLHNLATATAAVYKRELAGIAIVQRMLTPHEAPGSGKFAFKRKTGVQ